jgi:hypothetical protein
MSHAEAIKKRIAVVEKTICEQMYCDTIAEALELVAGKLRHEVHVQNLNDERAELSFLKTRLAAVESKANE